MDKKYLRGYILVGFVFIVYSTATIPFTKNVVFGIAFAFSLLAIVAQIYTVYTVMKNQALIKDRVYEFPLIRVSVLYLVVQLLASLLIMGFSIKVPIFAAVLVELLILVVAVIGFFAVSSAKVEAIRQDIQLHKELMKMKELQTRVNLLINQCEGDEIKEILHKLAEEIYYSNPLSVDISEEIDEEIAVLLIEVEAAALNGDTENTLEFCERMTALLRERDRICKHRR